MILFGVVFILHCSLQFHMWSITFTKRNIRGLCDLRVRYDLNLKSLTKVIYSGTYPKEAKHGAKALHQHFWLQFLSRQVCDVPLNIFHFQLYSKRGSLQRKNSDHSSLRQWPHLHRKSTSAKISAVPRHHFLHLQAKYASRSSLVFDVQCTCDLLFYTEQAIVIRIM